MLQQYVRNARADGSSVQTVLGQLAAEGLYRPRSDEDEPEGDALPAEPDYLWEPTRRGLLDRLGLENSAFGAEDPLVVEIVGTPLCFRRCTVRPVQCIG